MALSIYEDLEDAVVLAMAPLLDRIEVQPMPDTEADLKKTFVKARISVMYHSGKYSPPMSISGNLTQENSVLQIMIESRSRRGNLGVLHVKTLAEPILDGLIVPGWTQLTPHTFEYGQREGGLWVYNWLLKTDAVSHQENETYTGINLNIWS